MPKVLNNNEVGAVSNYIKKHTGVNADISISSPIFTIYAFQELKDILENGKKLKFLFNEPTFIRKISSNEKEVKEFQLQIQGREKNLSEFVLEIGLKNNLDQNQIASRCAAYIERFAEVRSVKRSGTVTANNILVTENGDENFYIQGNLAFSKDGLGYTKEKRYDFNTVTDENDMVQQYNEFFNSIFNNNEIVEDVKSKLLTHLANLYRENSPELLYFVTLYNIFGEKLLNTDDIARVKEDTGITKTKIWNLLYNFQHDAVVGAIKKLELYNGCIIADSVGLGKTFEALAIIKYYELRNNKVLVLTPKKIRSNWTGYKGNSVTNILADDRFTYEVLNHTDLSRETGYSGDTNLANVYWGNYDLVVIDESHNFRNDSAVKDRKTRYQKLMEDIIKNGIKTKVLMLSATPVNNRFADLKNQIRFITEDNDKAFKENVGINSVEHTLRIAQQRFKEWSKLPKEDQKTENLLPTLDFNFFNLLNTVTIARSRKHIQKYYDTKDIGEFPERLAPKSIKSDIDVIAQFPSLQKVNGLIAKFHLAVYSPMLYILPSKIHEYEEKYDQKVKDGAGSFSQMDRERNIVNLMRVNIFKRLESSINSFTLTLNRINLKIDDMLNTIENKIDFSDVLEEIDDDDLEDYEIGGKVKVKICDLDCIRIKQDLLEDKKTLDYLLDESKKITKERDAKLKNLKEEITKKIKCPINENNFKIIVFTSFSDTAIYLYEELSVWLLKEYSLYSGLVTGGSQTKTNLEGIHHSFEDILCSFSPKSNHFITRSKQIDLLIATDCISEGQNLQDCDYLINYDIHWNPVRIIQRFGRIDRIGSTNKFIQLVNFWPNMELDEYINLENRVRSRMVMLDLSATGEDDLLTAKSKDLEYRKNQLKQLQDEVLDLEDLQGGISITDLTFDDYIMSLERYMKDHPELLESYPTGIYAISDIPAKFESELEKGVVFCLKQKKYVNAEINTGSLYPYHLVYVKQDGNILISNINAKKILDVMKGLSIGVKEPLKDLVKQFNIETKNGNDMKVYTELIEKAVFNIKGIVEQRGVQSLFKLGKSSIIDNSPSGLNDFELITFMVIK
ncbi:MAG: helicase-related protein [Erysipelotrichaceae bacterium]